VGGTLFFSATDGSHGTELWQTNGTSAGTALVADILPGSASSLFLPGLTNVSGTLFFSADDGSHGQEVFKSNGTSTGTAMVKDINPGNKYFDGGSYPRRNLPRRSGFPRARRTWTTSGRWGWW
jgi:ELWxxDGT repeat protein